MPVEARAALAAALEALDGVRRATVDDDPVTVWLVCDGTEAPTELLVRALLAEHGLAAAEVPVHLSYLPPAEARRRVRFVSAAVDAPRAGGGHARVGLEWGGHVHAGDADGEAGAAMEMRLVAQATLRALEAVLGGRATFALLGIKAMRAFDADVVVVLVRSEGAQALVGAALATGDAHRAVALSVLNATNRLLGNYLSVPG
jgi:hypothetical protein